MPNIGDSTKPVARFTMVYFRKRWVITEASGLIVVTCRTKAMAESILRKANA